MKLSFYIFQLTSSVCGFLSQVVSSILSQMKEERADGLVGWSLSVVENSNLMSTQMSALATLFRFSSGKCLSLIYCLSYFISSNCYIRKWSRKSKTDLIFRTMFGLSCHQFPHGGRWQGLLFWQKKFIILAGQNYCQLSFW